MSGPMRRRVPGPLLSWRVCVLQGIHESQNLLVICMSFVNFKSKKVKRTWKDGFDFRNTAARCLRILSRLEQMLFKKERTYKIQKFAFWPSYVGWMLFVTEFRSEDARIFVGHEGRGRSKVNGEKCWQRSQYQLKLVWAICSSNVNSKDLPQQSHKSHIRSPTTNRQSVAWNRHCQRLLPIPASWNKIGEHATNEMHSDPPWDRTTIALLAQWGMPRLPSRSQR